MELDNIDAAKKMVQEGLGVALLPQTSIRQELEVGLLHQVEIADAKPPRHQLVAIRRRDLAACRSGRSARSSPPSRRCSRSSAPARPSASSRGSVRTTAQSPAALPARQREAKRLEVVGQPAGARRTAWAPASSSASRGAQLAEAREGLRRGIGRRRPLRDLSRQLASLDRRARRGAGAQATHRRRPVLPASSSGSAPRASTASRRMRVSSVWTSPRGRPISEIAPQRLGGDAAVAQLGERDRPVALGESSRPRPRAARGGCTGRPRRRAPASGRRAGSHWPDDPCRESRV